MRFMMKLRAEEVLEMLIIIIQLKNCYHPYTFKNKYVKIELCQFSIMGVT
jgi:hypothetical protein